MGENKLKVQKGIIPILSGLEKYDHSILRNQNSKLTKINIYTYINVHAILLVLKHLSKRGRKRKEEEESRRVKRGKE